MPNTSTPNQERFIKSLIGQRELNESATAAVTTARLAWQNGNFTKQSASRLIDQLKRLPYSAAAKSVDYTPAEDPEVGVYQGPAGEGDLIRVYKSKRNGRALAKRIFAREGAKPEYQYMGMAQRFITAEHRRLSLEEVGELGKAWDHCLLCGMRLNDPVSVDRGVGPVCAKKYVSAPSMATMVTT